MPDGVILIAHFSHLAGSLGGGTLLIGVTAWASTSDIAKRADMGTSYRRYQETGVLAASAAHQTEPLKPSIVYEADEPLFPPVSAGRVNE